MVISKRTMDCSELRDGVEVEKTMENSHIPREKPTQTRRVAIGVHWPSPIHTKGRSRACADLLRVKEEV